MNRGWEGGRKGGNGGRDAEREREKSGRKRRDIVWTGSFSFVSSLDSWKWMVGSLIRVGDTQGEKWTSSGRSG